MKINLTTIIIQCLLSDFESLLIGQGVNFFFFCVDLKFFVPSFNNQWRPWIILSRRHWKDNLMRNKNSSTLMHTPLRLQSIVWLNPTINTQSHARQKRVKKVFIILNSHRKWLNKHMEDLYWRGWLLQSLWKKSPIFNLSVNAHIEQLRKKSIPSRFQWPHQKLYVHIKNENICSFRGESK